MEQSLETYEKKVRQFFNKDKFVALAGIQIDSVDDVQATVFANVLPQHLNANGCVQGGMLYTLADFCFAILANYKHPATVTQCGHINYLRPAFTSKLKAQAQEAERVGHIVISNVTVYDDKDEVVCLCQFNGFVKDVDKEEYYQQD